MVGHNNKQLNPIDQKILYTDPGYKNLKKQNNSPEFEQLSRINIRPYNDRTTAFDKSNFV